MKTLLQLNNIHKAYGAQVIFSNLNVTISESQKIGVIGRNGAGKSTLCKIIAGLEEADSGTIQKSSDFRMAYLEQHDPYKADERVIDFLTRYTEKEEWQCGKIAARFQLKNELLQSEINALSGGFRTRVKLAAMLLMNPNLLILDEPTNYLDLKTQILLEEFLQSFRGGFLIVSHDREFLIRTCGQTLEIENGSCALYPGTVEEYLMFREQQNQVIENYNKGIIAKKKQLQLFVDKFKAKASKATQARSKMKQIEKLQIIETDHALGNVRLKIPNVEKRNLTAFSCDNLAIGYPELLVADRINMEFTQGAHIAILGDNGQGKTTYMRTIAGDLKEKGGSYKWGYGLKVSYYAQHVLLSLNPEDDVYTHLSNKAQNSVTRQDILDMAGSFLFKDNDVYKKIAVLSGGEKARLCLAGMLLSKSHVLLLDEPTNHLDFETVEALGKALKTFDGTVFFISHDRTFVNMLATQIVEVNDGAILRYPGKYEEYVYSMDAKIHEELKEDETAKPKPSIAKSDTKTEIKPNFKAGKNKLKYLKIERSRIDAQIREIHERLERHKKEWEEIHRSFAVDPASWSRERYARYEYLEKTIKEEEDIWLELTGKAEGITEVISQIKSRF